MTHLQAGALVVEIGIIAAAALAFILRGFRG